MSHLRVLGCLAYAHNKDTKGDKFASRSQRCILLGYPSTTKGWKIFDLEQEKAFISRDVEFQEDIFPYSDMKNTIHTQENSKIGSPITQPVAEENSEAGNSDILRTEEPIEDINTEHYAPETENSTTTSETETTKEDFVAPESENMGRGQRT